MSENSNTSNVQLPGIINSILGQWADDIVERVNESARFLGITTTAITDGSTVSTIVIAGESVSVSTGDIAVYNGNYFLFYSSAWHAGGGGGGPSSIAAEDVSYDNTTSGLTATDVQASTDEIVDILDDKLSYTELTQAEYDVLVEDEDVDPDVAYMITDRNQSGGTTYASGIIYDNTESELDSTNVQNAIDEVATVKSSIGNIDDVSITSPATGDMLSWDGSTWANLAMATIIDKIYPVGSIYISVTDSTVAQVETRFGGTWEAFGSGRTLIGVDTTDTDFNTVEKTGGANTINIQHSHTVNSHSHTISHAHTMAHTHAYGIGFPCAWGVAVPENKFYQWNGSSWSAVGSTSIRSDSVSVNSGLNQASAGPWGLTSMGWKCTTAGSSASKTGGTDTTNSGNATPGTDSKLNTAQSVVQKYITTYMYKRIA